MIKLDFNNQNDFPEVRQYANNPIVYLDTWAINDFIDSQELGEDFCKALEQSGGTWAWSYINMAEYCNRTDISQIESICSLLESLDSVTIPLNPDDIINNKDNRRSEYFPFDHRYTNMVIKINENKEKLVTSKDVQISKGLKIFVEREDLRNKLHEAMSDYSELNKCVAEYRKRFKNDASFKKQRKNQLRRIEEEVDQSKVALLKYVYFSLRHHIGSNPIKMDDNEWRDVFQIMVPLVYCDCILLENKWFDYAERVRRKFPNIGRIYNSKHVPDFINDLRNFSKEKAKND